MIYELADETFSVFEQVCLSLKDAKRPASSLGTRSDLNRTELESPPDAKFLTKVPSLIYWSLLIENMALADSGNQKWEMHVGFQRLSRMEAVHARYLRIAELVPTRVYGVNDWLPAERGRLDFLGVRPGSRLAGEWFVGFRSDGYSILMTCQDLDGFGAFADPRQRRFEGVKTTRDGVVAEAFAGLRALPRTAVASEG